MVLRQLPGTDRPRRFAVWKKRIALLAPVAACLVLIAGCTLGGADPEFAGAWSKTDGGQTMTWEFTRFTASVEVSGTSTGTAGFVLETYDQDKDHILMRVNAVTGAFGGVFRVDDTVYCTYSISGSDLYLLLSGSSYPPTATGGPYTRL
jgi:hypothetical protein